MIRRPHLRRNWKRSRSSKRRADLLKRLHFGEQLEVRAAPGSMIVDALVFGGHPIAMAQRASESAQESQHPAADGELASTRGAARVGAAGGGHAGCRDKPRELVADALSSDVSILVGTGLDDGLDASGIANPRRFVAGDQDVHRTPSSRDSGTSPGQLPDLPEGSDRGMGYRVQDRALSLRDAHSGYSAREIPDPGGTPWQNQLGRAGGESWKFSSRRRSGARSIFLHRVDCRPESS